MALHRTLTLYGKSIQLINPVKVYARIPEPTRKLLVIVLGQKCFFAFFLLTAPLLFPSLFLDDHARDRRFYTWDANFYLTIASNGYSVGGAECAFYPLWPIIIRIGSLLTLGNSVLAAYLIANAASLLGVLLFHAFAWKEYSLEIANRASILLLFFPGSIFFFFPYSESLFLLLLGLLLFGLGHGNITVIVISSFYLPMTRPIGIFIFPLVLWARHPKVSLRYRCIGLNAIVVGYLIYFLVIYLFTGDCFQGFLAQDQFPAKPSIVKMFDLEGFAKAFSGVRLEHSMLHSVIDRIFFIVFLVMLPFTFRFGFPQFGYSILVGLVPAISSGLMSFTRYFCVIYPIFLTAAWLCRQKKYVFCFLIVVGVAGQVCLFIRHISNDWAG